MHKLFALSHLRTLQRLGVSQISPASATQILSNNHLILAKQSLLYRLPREQLKHILKIPCPINNLQEPNASEIINSSKLLRHHCKFDEAKICSKCPFAEKCPSAKKTLENPVFNNSLRDLLIFFQALQHYLTPDNIYFRQWISAYRLGDSIIASIEDLSKGGLEIQQFETNRLDGIKRYQSRIKEESTTQPLSEEEKFKKIQNIIEKAEVKKQKRQQIKIDRKEEPKENDFTFDETKFEPTQSFTKSSFSQNTKKPYKKDQSYEKKPYQRQYNNDSPRFNQSYPNKYTPRNTNGQESQGYALKKGRDYEKRQPNSRDRFRQSDETNDFEDRPRQKWQKYAKPQYNREGSNFKDHSARDQGDYRQQKRYNNNNSQREQRNFQHQDRPTHKNYQQKSRQSEQYPKIREFGKKYQGSSNFKNREPQFPKPTPFVTKWKETENQSSRPANNANHTKPAFEHPRQAKTASKSQPKIMNFEELNVNQQRDQAPKAGRQIRRRRSTKDEGED